MVRDVSVSSICLGSGAAFPARGSPRCPLCYNSVMRSPFPGMDPYLEHPSLWPDVHNRLIAAIADDLGPLVAPNYYIRLERRTYILNPDDLVFIGRPDLSVLPSTSFEAERQQTMPLAAAGVVEVTLSMPDEVGESYLEVHEVVTGQVVTVMELLSPANKVYPKGREEYEQKRYEITRSDVLGRRVFRMKWIVKRYVEE